MKSRPGVYAIISTYVFVFSVLIGGVILLNRSVTALVEDKDIFKRSCVVIDPGHGGVDGGATSCRGILESQINLQISMKLNDLMHFIGLDTVMVRQTDQSIHTQGSSIAQKKISDLKERVRIVNNQNNALLISIHQNHYSDSRYYGPQVFYGKVGESSRFAVLMQNALNESLCPKSNRKAKRADGIYLMDQIISEGILIECGFLSNYEEEALLRDSNYQKKLCCVITTVCANYLNSKGIT